MIVIIILASHHNPTGKTGIVILLVYWRDLRRGEIKSPSSYHIGMWWWKRAWPQLLLAKLPALWTGREVWVSPWLTPGDVMVAGACNSTCMSLRVLTWKTKSEMG